MDFTFQIHPGTCLRGRIKIISQTRDFYTALDVVKASVEIFSSRKLWNFQGMVKGREDFLLFKVLIFLFYLLKKQGLGDGFWKSAWLFFEHHPGIFLFIYFVFFLFQKKFWEQSITTWGLMVYRTRVRKGGALKIFEA